MKIFPFFRQKGTQQRTGRILLLFEITKYLSKAYFENRIRFGFVRQTLKQKMQQRVVKLNNWNKRVVNLHNGPDQTRWVSKTTRIINYAIKMLEFICFTRPFMRLDDRGVWCVTTAGRLNHFCCRVVVWRTTRNCNHHNSFLKSIWKLWPTSWYIVLLYVFLHDVDACKYSKLKMKYRACKKFNSRNLLRNPLTILFILIKYQISTWLNLAEIKKLIFP